MPDIWNYNQSGKDGIDELCVCIFKDASVHDISCYHQRRVVCQLRITTTGPDNKLQVVSISQQLQIIFVLLPTLLFGQFYRI